MIRWSFFDSLALHSVRALATRLEATSLMWCSSSNSISQGPSTQHLRFLISKTIKNQNQIPQLLGTWTPSNAQYHLGALQPWVHLTNKLENGCDMVCDGCPSLYVFECTYFRPASASQNAPLFMVWGWRTVMFQSCGFYCKAPTSLKQALSWHSFGCRSNAYCATSSLRPNKI